MIYFCSDHHLSHKNIIEYCNRPFKTIKEMNECLVDNHNSIVSNKDDVYFLGDFCFNSSDFRYYMGRLNGNKHFIIGNHDPKNVYIFKDLFKSISQIKQIKYNNERIILCHFPMRSWNGMIHGYIHLFGHSHGQLQPEFNHIENQKYFSMDVGVDCWNYRPVSIETILQLKYYFDKDKKEKYADY